MLELLPVFARKPLWGYRLAVAGMMGVALLWWFVWQHHLFVSGMNGDLRPFYMFSTELISIPTGSTFLCGMMTLWRGQIRSRCRCCSAAPGSSTSCSAACRVSSSRTRRAT